MQFWSYLAQFLLEWEMFQTKVVQKIKTHILSSFFLSLSPRKSCSLWDNLEKYGRAGQATDDNLIQSMRIACWITKATNTRSDYVIHTVFPLHSRLHVIHILPVLLRYTWMAMLRSRTLLRTILRGPAVLPDLVWSPFLRSTHLENFISIDPSVCASCHPWCQTSCHYLWTASFCTHCHGVRRRSVTTSSHGFLRWG